MSFFRDFIKGEKRSPRLHQDNIHQVAEAIPLPSQPPPTLVESTTISAAQSETQTNVDAPPIPQDNTETSLPPISEREATTAAAEALAETPLPAASGAQEVPVGTVDPIVVTTSAASVEQIKVPELPPTQLVTVTLNADEGFSTSSPYYKKKLTKEEAANIYMYGPREEDIWTVPNQAERPSIDVGVTHRSNRAQSMRQSHIAKVTEERIAFARAEARQESLANKLLTETAKKRDEEKSRRKLIEHYLTTSIPEDTSTLLSEFSTQTPAQSDILISSTVLPITTHVNSVNRADGSSISSVTESISNESFTESENEADSTKVYGQIPKAIYTQPKIVVRDTMNSKFRYLYNRKPQGVLLYFRSVASAQRKKPPFITAVPSICYH